MLQAVIDTNILVSGILIDQSLPGRVLTGILDSRVQPVVDERIFDEYTRVLTRPSFKFNTQKISNLLDELKQCSRWITPSYYISTAPDEGDIPFAEAALSVKVPLVTGNMRHFPDSIFKKLRVLSPKEFLELLNVQD